MEKVIMVNYEEEKQPVHIFITKNNVTTHPKIPLLEFSVKEMMDDIGKWDFNYLKELIGNNETLYHESCW